MAKDQSKNKTRIVELLILVFVVVSMGLLAVQIGMNVADTLAQERTVQETPMQTLIPPTSTETIPVEPTPTFDIGSVDIKDA